MNRKMIFYIVLKLMQVEGVLLLIPALVSFIYGEKTGITFLFIALGILIVATLLSLKKPKNQAIYAKEGLVIVALSWIAWSMAGALPFYITGAIPRYIDALFETVSGFTTTGATILSEIESLPKGILFWRSFTHWIGGMGVLVFALAIIPLAKERSMFLMRAEVPGPTVDKLVPKISTSAKILYGMYIALTFMEIIFLYFGGMSLFESTLHAFSTAGTGGFSTRNASISAFNSAYIDGVITVFMLLFGINFNMYYFILIKNFKGIFSNDELKGYLGIVAGSILIITIWITPQYSNPLTAFRYASFQVASIITTTGFVTADFNFWPMIAKNILVLLMVIGACAGSTGGGIKVSRLIVGIRSIKNELKHMIHPRAITVVKLDGRTVDKEVKYGITNFLIAYVLILCVSALIISFDNFNFETTWVSVISCISNIGPSLGEIGPFDNFYNFSFRSKLVFCADMLIGRLEIFPILLLFAPSVWKKKFV